MDRHASSRQIEPGRLGRRPPDPARIAQANRRSLVDPPAIGITVDARARQVACPCEAAMLGDRGAMVVEHWRHPRSSDAAIVAKMAKEIGVSVEGGPADVASGIRRALELASDGDLVVGTGTLSVAAEIIEEQRGIEPEVYPYMKRPASPAPRAIG